MTSNTLAKGQAMRLAKDFSNIEDFAYFVGGQIYPSGDETPTVLLADNKTYLHGGYYAVATDSDIKKWYPDEFEANFVPRGDIESTPKGWVAYPEGTDFSVYGKYVAEFSREELNEAKELARSAKFATFLTRKSKVRKMEASPVVDKLSFAIYGDTEDIASAEEVNTVLNREEALLCFRWGFTAIFPVDGGKRYVLVRQFTESVPKVQQFLNRTR